MIAAPVGLPLLLQHTSLLDLLPATVSKSSWFNVLEAILKQHKQKIPNIRLKVLIFSCFVNSSSPSEALCQRIMCVWVRRAFFLSFLGCGGHSGWKPQLSMRRLRLGEESRCTRLLPMDISEPFGLRSCLTATGLKWECKSQHKSKWSHLMTFQVALLCVFFFCTNNFTKLRNRCRHH